MSLNTACWEFLKSESIMNPSPKGEVRLKYFKVRVGNLCLKISVLAVPTEVD